MGRGLCRFAFCSFGTDVFPLDCREAVSPPAVRLWVRVFRTETNSVGGVIKLVAFSVLLKVLSFSSTVGWKRVKARGKVIYEGQMEFRRFKYTSSVPASFGSSHLGVPVEKLDTEFLQVLL